ncbi:MAG: HAMP domain-containing histidine kinase [Bacteroides sp.]|nr:HAMP domain-containing histidine kinase [Bacteroides sp.]
MRKSIIAILMTFCLSIMTYAQTPRDRATELKEQAQSSLNQKDYIKARYLFKKAYEAFATRENYPQAIECGVQANALYVRENFYKEGFELCRDMDQLIWAGEQNQKKVFYDLRFLVNKERLQMYTALKNPAQAKTQLNKLEETANLAKNDSLTEVLLYTKANYYYTFNQNCYKNLIGIARKANNAPLMERTYESYIVWTDSVKALTAQDELNVLKRKYDESQLTIQEKDDTLSAKQYIIIGLCVLVVILVAGLAILAAILLKFIAGNRKLKKSVKIANEHNELKTKFIQNISSQMEPTLNTLATSANELLQKAPQEASQMQSQVAALKKFSDDIQELSSLENSLTELYELGEINVGTFCENVMDKVKEHIKIDVTPSVNAPKLQVKTNKEQLERILLYLLRNAAFYTEQGRISLEFKKRGAHTHQFIVTDTGIGIPAEQQENIFKPFTEVKDLTTGDGLGLPICSLIAAKMNGSLTLDIGYTKGTRFILELHV